ncbi:hypothetical protein GCM10028820_09660 [Tessaracoccus terricola]
MLTLTPVKSCAATTCAYNQDGCAAGAITVAGSANAARCDTFLALDARGGLPVAAGTVGACQRLECVHNKDLMCTATDITVTDTAVCTTYEVAPA